MGGLAWVTLATNDSYSLGALVLAHSLKQVETNKQLVVLITPGVTKSMREKLSAVFNVVQEVNILDSKDETNLKLLKRPELGVTFTKLHCWRLTQFDKCVFLDADTLVLQNCDELFEREELSAAPDVGWPDCFNSGVFVYRPSNETYEKLVQFALEKGTFDGGDQGLLNLYFSDWSTKDITKHLPFIYNLCSTACYSYLPAFKQFGAGAKIIHFIGASKPWLQYFNTETKRVQSSGDLKHLERVLQHWWDIFCSLIHPQLTSEMGGLAGAFAQLTLGTPRTAEQNALDDHLRRQGWEVGNIDYLGRDSFDNIWSKICETLSTGPGAPAPATSSRSAPAPKETPPPSSDAKSVETSLIEAAVELPKQEIPPSPLTATQETKTDTVVITPTEFPPEPQIPLSTSLEQPKVEIPKEALKTEGDEVIPAPKVQEARSAESSQCPLTDQPLLQTTPESCVLSQQTSQPTSSDQDLLASAAPSTEAPIALPESPVPSQVTPLIPAETVTTVSTTQDTSEFSEKVPEQLQVTEAVVPQEIAPAPQTTPVTPETPPPPVQESPVSQTTVESVQTSAAALSPSPPQETIAPTEQSSVPSQAVSPREISEPKETPQTTVIVAESVSTSTAPLQETSAPLEQSSASSQNVLPKETSTPSQGVVVTPPKTPQTASAVTEPVPAPTAVPPQEASTPSEPGSIPAEVVLKESTPQEVPQGTPKTASATAKPVQTTAAPSKETPTVPQPTVAPPTVPEVPQTPVTSAQGEISSLCQLPQTTVAAQVSKIPPQKTPSQTLPVLPPQTSVITTPAQETPTVLQTPPPDSITSQEVPTAPQIPPPLDIPPLQQTAPTQEMAELPEKSSVQDAPKPVELTTPQLVSEETPKTMDSSTRPPPEQVTTETPPAAAAAEAPAVSLITETSKDKTSKEGAAEQVKQPSQTKRDANVHQGAASTTSPTPPPRKGTSGGKKSKSKK